MRLVFFLFEAEAAGAQSCSAVSADIVLYGAQSQENGRPSALAREQAPACRFGPVVSVFL